MNVLIVVDMQNDFVSGALGTPEAQKIVPAVVKRVKEASAGESRSSSPGTPMERITWRPRRESICRCPTASGAPGAGS